MSDWGGRVLSILSPWHMLGVLPAFGYLGEVVGGRWCKLRLHPFRLPAAAKGEASWGIGTLLPGGGATLRTLTSLGGGV